MLSSMTVLDDLGSSRLGRLALIRSLVATGQLLHPETPSLGMHGVVQWCK